MRKIEKDLSVVPDSLNDRKTVKRRDNIIKNGVYPLPKKAKEFNKRFKQKDILDKLGEKGLVMKINFSPNKNSKTI